MAIAAGMVVAIGASRHTSNHSTSASLAQASHEIQAAGTIGLLSSPLGRWWRQFCQRATNQRRGQGLMANPTALPASKTIPNKQVLLNVGNRPSIWAGVSTTATAPRLLHRQSARL